MNTQRAAEIQVVLEGIKLPATRDELVSYAMGWDPPAAVELSALPDRSYGRIDEVGEALLQVQPAQELRRRFPHRHSAPPDNPPRDAIEKTSKTLKRQAAVQAEG
jgi:hypothetical protein